MPPTKSSTTSIKSLTKKYLTWNYFKSLIIDPAKLPFAAVVILFVELFVNIFVVQNVTYTEIDWIAYMQECEGFLNGTFDYTQLKGDTGPLVYPAGFVYIYSILYFITNHGTNVRLAQYIFIGVYLMQLLFVLRIYIKTRKVPPYVLVLTILTSYRIHSIYVLRLFNDPIAVLLFYIALNLFLSSKWTVASIFYSLAVSVKMNILLYAPALLIFYLFNLGLTGTFKQLFICGLLQLIFGLPFLISNPIGYVKGSFDLGRVFNHTWTVNYRFLDVPTFESKCFHLSLLGLHICLLGLFYPMMSRYFSSYVQLRKIQNRAQSQIDAKNKEKRKPKKQKKDEKLTAEQEKFLNSFEKSLQKSTGNVAKQENQDDTFYSINFDSISQLFILPMFITNFIGIACARSLHYQFYSWYFHTLPYLLWSTDFQVIKKFLILALIEFCWNKYPSTEYSSCILHLCHVTILYGVYMKVNRDLAAARKAVS